MCGAHLLSLVLTTVTGSSTTTAGARPGAVGSAEPTSPSDAKGDPPRAATSAVTSAFCGASPLGGLLVLTASVTLTSVLLEGTAAAAVTATTAVAAAAAAAVVGGVPAASTTASGHCEGSALLLCAAATAACGCSCAVLRDSVIAFKIASSSSSSSSQSPPPEPCDSPV
jgi:hypothetical protein